MSKEDDIIADKPAEGFSLSRRPRRVVVLFILIHPHFSGPTGVPAWTETQHLLRHSNDSAASIPAASFNDSTMLLEPSYVSYSLQLLYKYYCALRSYILCAFSTSNVGFDS